MEEELKNSEQPQGAFVTSLLRNNKQIKADRGTAIADEAETVYRRKVEDLGIKIKRLKWQRENMLDLSPDNSLSLMLAGNFDADKFAEEDLKIGRDIRDLEILYELAQKRYTHLYGKTVNA